MSPTKIIVALALLLGATSMSVAQSQPNCGPGGNTAGDTYGKPPSGSAAAQRAARHHCHYRR
jgi:hypothetical protein